MNEHVIVIKATANETQTVIDVPAEPSERIIVILSTQMGTGYDWHIDGGMSHETRLVSGEEKEPKTGQTEQREFCLYAPSSGQQQFKLIYKRGWEKNAEGIRKITLNVHINE